MHADFTTVSVRPGNKLKAWQEIVHAACVPLSFRCKQDAQFYGEISSRDIDDICISMVKADEHFAKHDKFHISRTSGDYFLASLQLSGEGFLEQDGRGATVLANNLVVYDSNRPYQWSFKTGFNQLVLRIPRHHLKYRLDLPLNHTAQSVPCHTGMGKVAIDYLVSLFHQAELINSGNHQSLANSAVDILTATLSAHSNSRCGQRTNIQSMHLRQACKVIAERIRDAELNPEMIARALGISVRYLHHLFRSLDTSVCRYILLRRLSGCELALSDPNFASTSISEIAFAWGFNSAVHFSRIFRAEIGMAPRDYRLMHSKKLSQQS